MIKTIIGQLLFGAFCFVSGWAGSRLKFSLDYGGARFQIEVILLIAACLALGALVYIIDAIHNDNATTTARAMGPSGSR